MSRHHPKGVNKMALSNLLSAEGPADDDNIATLVLSQPSPKNISDMAYYSTITIGYLCDADPTSSPNNSSSEHDAASLSESRSPALSLRHGKPTHWTSTAPQNNIHQVSSSAAAAARLQGRETRAKRPWTHAEDELLRALVAQMGIGMWASIAQHIPGRSGKQVRERWLNHLSPLVTKTPWSEEEDRLILETHVQFGNAWSKIARLLKGRSDNSVKNRFYTTLKRRYIVTGGSADDHHEPSSLLQQQSTPTSTRRVDPVGASFTGSTGCSTIDCSYANVALPGKRHFQEPLGHKQETCKRMRTYF